MAMATASLRLNMNVLGPGRLIRTVQANMKRNTVLEVYKQKK